MLGAANIRGRCPQATTWPEQPHERPVLGQSELAGTLHVVSVAGELDQATVPRLREELTPALEGDGSVIVDLDGCGFIDSTGLSLLVESRRQLTDGVREFAVCSPDDEVRRLLELTGIDKAISLYDTRDDAVSALSKDGAPAQARDA